jgi:hypothetical protein
MPDLSDTLMSACLIVAMMLSIKNKNSAECAGNCFFSESLDSVPLHFFTQSVAVDTQQFRRSGQIAASMFQRHFEQRFLDTVYDHVIHAATGLLAVEIPKIFLECLAHITRHIVFIYQTIAHAANLSM